jgi:xanthine/uracil permease
MPLTTFAQNNGGSKLVLTRNAMCPTPEANACSHIHSGVIALTNVAARQAGWACAFWLLLLGIFGKFGGWVRSIPNCVLGGMTTFLFANVIGSGIKVWRSTNRQAASHLRALSHFALLFSLLKSLYAE